ncbi:MAG TPA: type II secretion system protein [Blastocatellia bacterium]|nr:type II secretion system protein [Blastocatellia bacterium]
MKRTKRESGYALLSLLVAMTISLVILASMASKPSAQFVGQRENEEEAFFRAYQVSNAIQIYANLKGGVAPQNLPTKLEDLLDKISVQGKEFYIVRKSAMTDPLTGTEWKAVRLGDPKVKEFTRTYMRVLAEQQALAMASGGVAPGVAPGVAGQQQGLPPILMLAAQASGVNLASPNAGDEKEEENTRASSASGFSLDIDSDSRPIVGVMSSSKKQMIRNYYEIETYEKALFFAGVPVPGLNMAGPLGGSTGGPPMGPAPPPGPGEPDTRPKLLPGQCPPGSTDPRCPRNRFPSGNQ